MNRAMSGNLILLTLLALPTFPSTSLFGSTPLGPTPERPQILIGPTFLLNRNYHSGGFHTTQGPSCPLFENGTGWGFGFGLSAEFTPVIDGSWSIIPRITFEQRPGEFHQQLPDVQVLLPDPTSTNTASVINQTVLTASSITYTILNAEVMYKQEVLKKDDFRIALSGGPAISHVISGKNYQVQDLIEPTNARFLNIEGYQTTNFGRRLIFYDGDIANANGTRISLKGGMQGEFALFGNQWIISPGIYYDYGLTTVSQTENWNLNSIIFQVDFRRGF